MKISYKAAVIVALALATSAAPACADDSLFETFGKSTGLIMSPPDPPDFVKATRPKAEPTSMPVFAQPEEPRSKVKSPSELKAMDADLERASHRQDALRESGAAPDEAKKRSKMRDGKIK